MRIGRFVFLLTLAWVLVTPGATFAQAKPTAAQGDAAWMLKQDMRKLWTDHVVWTRDYIVAATGKQPDAPSALTRLMKNQDDIGNAVAKYYGAPAGRQLLSVASRLEGWCSMCNPLHHSRVVV